MTRYEMATVFAAKYTSFLQKYPSSLPYKFYENNHLHIPNHIIYYKSKTQNMKGEYHARIVMRIKKPRG